MRNVPQQLKSQAEGYIRLTADTLEGLAFLLDNLGESVRLDLSTDSVAALEALLRRLRDQPNPGSPFPDVVELLAQLLAQYGALVILKEVNALWTVDATPSSHYFGQPYVDVVPSEPWQRYYPIHWQQVLQDRKNAPGPQQAQLHSQIASGIRAHQHFDKLKDAIARAIAASPIGTMSHEEILAALEQMGVAPDASPFGVDARKFPQRIADILRHAGTFQKDRADGRWKLARR